MNPAMTKTPAFAALLLSLPALAGTPINEQRSLQPDGRLHVANSSGSIEVEGWDRPQMQLGGTLGDNGPKLEISGDARDLRVEVRVPRGSYRYDSSELKLKVPAGVQLEVVGVSSDVSVTGLSGPVEAHSVSGDVTLDLQSATVEAQTVSGDLRLRGPVQRCRLNSVSGDIQAEGLSGELQLETVSGNVDLQGGTFSRLASKSISGDMQMRLALSADGTLEGETLSGQIRTQLQGTPSARVSLRSFSGQVRSELAGSSPVVAGDDRLELKLGQGRGRIDLSSFSGDIELLK